MSKENLFKVLRHEEAERVPWVPVPGVHAGALKGYSAYEVSTDADKLYESMMEVRRLYQPDGMPAVFDLQLEAEILGCELGWTANYPATVMKGAYADRDDIPTDDMIPGKDSGRIPVVLDAMERMKQSVGDSTALYGVVTGPFMLAFLLRGMGIFMDMGREKEKTDRLFDFCAKTAAAMAGYYIDAGMDVIAIADPMLFKISPRSIEKQLKGPLTRIVDYIRERGAFSSFYIAGTANKQIRTLCEMRPDMIHIDSSADLPAAKLITDEYNIVLEGNIPQATTMLHGSAEDNRKAVIDIYDSVPDKSNFILSHGYDMPYEVPVENAVAVAEAALHIEETRRRLLQGAK